MKAGTQWAVGPERRFRHLAAMAADCPVCKKPLLLKETGESLKCTQCRRVYPVRDDIPVMLVDEARIEAE